MRGPLMQGGIRSAVALGLLGLVSACGPRAPSNVDIVNAYAARTKPVERADGTQLAVFKGHVTAANSGECEYGYNGYFICPVTISDQEPNGRRDTHRKALVMIEWADGWQVRQVQ